MLVVIELGFCGSPGADGFDRRFDANKTVTDNLLAVCKAMREPFAGCPLIICRDDDWKTTKPNGDAWNPGEEKANNAALIIGGQVVAPIFSSEREVK